MQMVLLVLLSVIIVGCKERDVRLKTGAITNRKNTPVLLATDVNTLISDSGIVRYRIETPVWKVFDKADTPHWEFPEGIYLEKFNLDLKAEAFVEAEYAYYNEPEQYWMLRGNVRALNLEGEMFETPLIYLNQKTDSVYSDTTIVITRKSSVISGKGFHSNPEMTKYRILHPTGYFPIEEEQADSTAQEQKNIENEI